jgi:hypothetical protein
MSIKMETGVIKKGMHYKINKETDDMKKSETMQISSNIITVMYHAPFMGCDHAPLAWCVPSPLQG